MASAYELSTSTAGPQSPANGFVSILTPAANDNNGDAGKLELNGLQLGSWVCELKDCDVSSGYFWTVFFFPAIPLSQLRVRLGLTNYGKSLACAVIPNLLMIWLSLVFICYAFSLQIGLEMLTAALAFLGLWLLLVAWVGKLRGYVRQRFEIPGSEKEDLRIALLHTTKAIYQMARHVKIDRALVCGAPATLQAYEV